MEKYLKEVKEILGLKELRIFPSYLAYNFILALIPTLTLFILITNIFSISTDRVVDLIQSSIPHDIADIIINIMSTKNYSFGIGFLNVTTIYASSRGMYALIEVSDSLYDIGKRKYVQKRLKSISILVIIILSLSFLLLIPILGSKLLSMLSEYRLITKKIPLLYKVFKWPLTFLFIYFSIKLIYIIAPSKRIKSKDVTLGALVVAVGWLTFTYIFGYYLDYFSKYDAIYGGLSSIVILLIWLYILSYILILGIVINTRVYNKQEKKVL